MAKPTLYFFCPDLRHVLGGMKQIYRHVDVLNANGFDAWVVHRKKGFKVTWFEHKTRVMYGPPPLRKEIDVGVFPEIWGAKINQGGKFRRVIFNQNAYYTFVSSGLRERLVVPYTNPQVMATIVVSEDSKRYMEYVFPRMPIYRIRYSINPKLYYPGPKKKQICVMPRKNVEDLKQVLHILNLRGALVGWKVVLIDKFSEEKTAEVLRESAVFISTSSPEGFGLPPCEAMRCGCIVVGYSGRGGDEFLQRDWSFPVPVGDIIGFARTVERVLKEYVQDRSELTRMIEKAREFAGKEYSEDQERDTIVTAWRQIVDI